MKNRCSHELTLYISILRHTFLSLSLSLSLNIFTLCAWRRCLMIKAVFTLLYIALKKVDMMLKFALVLSLFKHLVCILDLLI